MAGKDATERFIDALQAAGKTVKATKPDHWEAQCPAHDDSKPSLGVSRGSGQVLVFCRSAGCQTVDIAAALNLEMRDLFDKPKITNEYWDNGKKVREKYRYPNKTFSQTVFNPSVVTLYNPAGVESFAGLNVYVVEGEKDADTLARKGVVAVTHPLGAANWAKADWTPLYKAAGVIIIADKDEVGMKSAFGIHDLLAEHVPTVGVYAAKEGKDASDHDAAGHELTDFVEIEVPNQAETPPRAQTAGLGQLEQRGDRDEYSPRLFTRINAVDLMAKEFPPLQYLVDGIIPTGVSLIVAPPKFGKSWFALGLAEACSTGGQALGQIPTKERPVLYLALEDGLARLQSRMKHMSLEARPNLELVTRLDGHDITEWLELFLTEHHDSAPLIILDTLGKVAPVSRSNGNQYAHDYAFVGAMKERVDQVSNASLQIVHHTNKGEKNDFVDSVSGTQGIAGAVDTIIVLKRDRSNKSALMQVTSRDAEEGEYGITFTNDCHWILDGTSVHDAKRAAARTRLEANLGDGMIRMLNTIALYPEGVTRSGLGKTLPELSTVLGSYLERAVQRGDIRKLARGIYAPLDSGAPCAPSATFLGLNLEK